MTPNNMPPNLQAPGPVHMPMPAHLTPPTKPVKIVLTSPKAETHPPRNNLRELVETVVFVTILVLLLKSFVAEAFVIPTGSMAETLLGYRAYVTCPECGHEFPINISEEIEPRQGGVQRVSGCTCPNCRAHIIRDDDKKQWVRDPVFFWNCGDRVLVAKWPNQTPNRWDVVVFKYPKTPIENSVPMNYIKRLTGLPGETIAILEGDLYTADGPIDYSDQRQPTREEDRWEKSFMHINALNAQEAFRSGKFKILRKPPAEILAMMRIVYDNDKQPNDLVDVVPPRWQAGDGWKANNEKKPTSFTATGDGENWLRYKHIWVEHVANMPKPNGDVQPKLIQNMMGYNFIDTPRVNKFDEDHYWVGDLILEANVDVANNQGEVIFELSRGRERYQVVFNLADGKATLFRNRAVNSKEIGSTPSSLNKIGKHTVRFANVDQRLTVWVDNKLIFGDGIEYDADRGAGPDEVNDKQPASVGVRGGAKVTVSGLKLWRDTYYTAPGMERARAPGEADMTMYIQPGHYLCMGDNSTQSSDGREWGSVPERLMLGRAVMVYFPVWPFAQRFGPIR